MTSAEQAANLFDGPGDVRRLGRSVDWSTTPLGPIESWSPVLRVVVGVCLSSDFPMIVNWGPELVAVYNDAYAPLLGRKHPAALGQSPKDTWPEAWEWVGPRLSQVLQDGRTLRLTNEQQMLERSGYPEECYFSFSQSPITDADGRINGILTVATETTAAVLNERRTRVVQQLGALSFAENGSTADICRAAMDVLSGSRQSMPFAIMYLGEQGGPPERIAEYGISDEVDLRPGHSPLDASLAPSVDRVIAKGKPEIITGLRTMFPGAFMPGPLGPLTPDTAVVLPLNGTGNAGLVGALVLGASPYRGFDEKYQDYFSLLGQQIRVALTDALFYQRELNRVQMLVDLDLSKMDFIQNISHELRTPLALLLAPLQDLAAAATEYTAGQRQDLEAAVRAAERLRHLVDALLNFSGTELARLVPSRRDVDIAGLTADVASMFRAAAEHKGLQLTVEVPPAPLIANVDQLMWSTVVTNLLSNSAKYTSNGTIDVALRRTGAEAFLTVTDTGSGISAESQALVFERFYRAPGTQSIPGAGIGLALVADVVRTHQGHVTLKSSPGAGTTITVTIPLGAYVPQAVQAASEDLPESSLPRVLVVEDDTDLREYLTRLLTGDGWSVDAVPDAETANGHLRSAQYRTADVILTDIMLPGRSGLSLVRDVREVPGIARLPIIVLTARGGPDAAGEGLAAGADDYITKPFSSGELLARVRAHHELNQQRESAVVRAEERATQVRSALESNRAIGTAVGVVMANYRLTAAQGFQLLISVSQHTNSKLRDIANHVAEKGVLPIRSTLLDELLIKVAGSGSKPR